MDDELSRLRRRLRRQKEARRQAEWIAEEKTRELFQRNQELITLSNNQEQVIHERTRDLEFQNVILEQSRKELIAQKQALATKSQELERSNQYKDEFLSNLSHELRTPLNPLMILTDLLIDGSGDEAPTSQQKESLLNIKSNAQELLSLINTTLDMSEVVAGRLQLARKTVQLTDITSALALRYEKLASEKSLEFILTVVEGSRKMIDTDPKRLIQVLEGLLDNALKFTQKGRITLTIESTTKPQPQWLITVKDSGIGIDSAQHDRVFEPFQQLDGSLHRQYGGTGSGLSLCKKLVELMGGTIYLESTLGQGTEFTIHLPIYDTPGH